MTDDQTGNKRVGQLAYDEHRTSGGHLFGKHWDDLEDYEQARWVRVALAARADLYREIERGRQHVQKQSEHTEQDDPAAEMNRRGALTYDVFRRRLIADHPAAALDWPSDWFNLADHLRAAFIVASRAVALDTVREFEHHVKTILANWHSPGGAE